MPTLTKEGELSVSAPRMWKAMKDADNVFPTVAPQFFASIEDEGGKVGTVGSVRTIMYGSAAPPGTYAKEKLTAIDHEKFTLSTEEIEGAHLAQGFSKWNTTIKFDPVDKSCKFKVTINYEGDHPAKVTQAEEGFVQLFKGISAYIETNNAYL